MADRMNRFVVVTQENLDRFAVALLCTYDQGVVDVGSTRVHARRLVVVIARGLLRRAATAQVWE